ncbi:MAG: hypothetical protein Q9202_006280, partial [Teloschistes flavicans]
VKSPVDMDEDGGHLWRPVWHNEVPDPVEAALTWRHIAGLSGDEVADETTS